MSARPAWLTLAIMLAATVSGCGSYEINDSAQRDRLNTIRDATAVYKDVNAAISAGYRPSPGCVESDNDSGALGQAYQNLRLNQDQQVDLLRPELLFYEEKQSGAQPSLVGVGYLVPDEDQRPPKIPLGHLDGPIPATGPGQQDRFELHAWVHRNNPDGALATWNPDVSCP
jgi:hypothetical protein